MLLLLPPSEGKTPPAAGAPGDPSALSHPEIADARARVATTLAKVSGQRNAAQVLGLGATNVAEAAWNLALDIAPADAAARVYTGVLYDAAGAARWDGAALNRASGRVRIVSALWGALSPADRIPAYRLPMNASLGRIGKLAAFWRPRLAAPLGELAGDGLVVDCRSAAYVDAWRPDGTDWVTVKVLTEANGKRTVVSHWAKHARGVLAGHLATADAQPRSAADLIDAAREAPGLDLVDVTLGPRPSRGPRTLELVLRG